MLYPLRGEGGLVGLDSGEESGNLVHGSARSEPAPDEVGEPRGRAGDGRANPAGGFGQEGFDEDADGAQ